MLYRGAIEGHSNDVQSDCDEEEEEVKEEQSEVKVARKRSAARVSRLLASASNEVNET